MHMGLPSYFYMSPIHGPLPKFPLTLMGGLDPSLERKDMAISSGVGDLKKTNVVSIQGEHTKGSGGNVIWCRRKGKA